MNERARWLAVLALGGVVLLGAAATASARRSSGGGWSPRSIQVTDEASAIESAADLPEDFKGQLVPRSISSVDTLVVHQTGVLGGFGAPSAEARRQRYRKTPYHVVYSPRDRASHWQWPIWAWSYHGHCLNAKSIGWAYDGLISEGSASDELDVEGARESLRHAVARARTAGAPLRWVLAHRQGDEDRGGDPGREIWRRVVMPSLGELQLEAKPNDTCGDGKSLPKSWQA